MRNKDLTGHRFGMLTVLEADEKTVDGHTLWLCRCDCGNLKSINGKSLVAGLTRSCGCLRHRTPSNALDLKGQTFGRLRVIDKACSRKGCAYWLCECECGARCEVSTQSLRKGETKSCGCFHAEILKKHRQELSENAVCKNKRLYRIYTNMKQRCYNKNEFHYSSYGGRGITVCDEWRESYEAFQKWALENGYRDDLTIDRKDNDGDYCPENCRWATLQQQANNKRGNRTIEFNGQAHTLSEWEKITGLKDAIIRERLNAGWSIESALTTPVAKRTKRKKEGQSE